MRRSGGGGLGYVVAVVVFVVVMLLAAKAWNAVLPKAAQAIMPSVAARPGAAAGGAGAASAGASGAPASATRPSGLPDLKEMGQNTDRHIRQVEDAAAKQD